MIYFLLRSKPLTSRSSGLTSVWKDPAEYSLFVNYVPDQSLSKYVAWDLEREHGDLGLESGCTTDMPPLSALGIALKSTKYGTKIHDWIREIVRYTDGSILQTKLFLDRIHNAQSPEAVDLGPGRLPRNVQAHFDTAIRTIEQRSAHLDSTLAMKSIAAIGKDGNMFQGLNVSDLASLLQEPMYRRDPNAFLIRSMEDIIYLANGYLKLVPPLPSEQECGVATSNRLLWLYAYDDYDERIIMEYSQLRTARIPRSFSFSNSTRTDMSELKSLPLPCRRNSLGLPFVSHTSKQEQ